MTARALVLGAHGLDLLTMLPLLAVYGIAGEANPVARAAYAAGGILALVLLKSAGAVLLAALAGHPVRAAIAVAAGLSGALINAIAWSTLR